MNHEVPLNSELLFYQDIAMVTYEVDSLVFWCYRSILLSRLVHLASARSRVSNTTY